MRISLDATAALAAGGASRTHFRSLVPALAALVENTDCLELAVRGAPPDELLFLARHDSVEIGAPQRRGLFRGRGADALVHAFYPAAELRGLPGICTVNAIEIESSSGGSRLSRALARELRRFTLLVAPTPEMARQLRSLGSEERSFPDVEVVTPGVDTRFSRPPGPSVLAQLFERFPFLESPYLLGVPSPTRSGSEQLVRVHRAVLERRPQTPPLVLYVERIDPGLDELLRRSDPSSTFVVTDTSADDLPAIFRGARLALLTAQAPRLGMAALEAAAAGVPSIVSPLCAVRELIPATAFRSPKGIEPWSAQIASLLDDPQLREDAALEGQRVAAGMSWEAAAELYLELYRRLEAS